MKSRTYFFLLLLWACLAACTQGETHDLVLLDQMPEEAKAHVMGIVERFMQDPRAEGIPVKITCVVSVTDTRWLVVITQGPTASLSLVVDQAYKLGGSGDNYRSSSGTAGECESLM